MITFIILYIIGMLAVWLIVACMNDYLGEYSDLSLFIYLFSWAAFVILVGVFIVYVLNTSTYPKILSKPSLKYFKK